MSDAKIEACACALYCVTRRGAGPPLSPAQRREALKMWRTLPEHSKETWREGARAVLIAAEEHDAGR